MSVPDELFVGLKLLLAGRDNKTIAAALWQVSENPHQLMWDMHAFSDHGVLVQTDVDAIMAHLEDEYEIVGNPEQFRLFVKDMQTWDWSHVDRHAAVVEELLNDGLIGLKENANEPDGKS